MSRRFRTPAALILILACAGTLAGCGVKGPLEPPPKAAASGAPQAAAATPAPAEASSESSWSINQANIVADTGTAAPPLSASTSSTASTGTPSASTSTGSSGSRSKSTHIGGSSAAPTSLDQITRPHTPFILDGLL